MVSAIDNLRICHYYDSEQIMFKEFPRMGVWSENILWCLTKENTKGLRPVWLQPQPRILLSAHEFPPAHPPERPLPLWSRQVDTTPASPQELVPSWCSVICVCVPGSSGHRTVHLRSSRSHLWNSPLGGLALHDDNIFYSHYCFLLSWPERQTQKFLNLS